MGPIFYYYYFLYLRTRGPFKKPLLYMKVMLRLKKRGKQTKINISNVAIKLRCTPHAYWGAHTEACISVNEAPASLKSTESIASRHSSEVYLTGTFLNYEFHRKFNASVYFWKNHESVFMCWCITLTKLGPIYNVPFGMLNRYILVYYQCIFRDWWNSFFICL